MKGFSLIEILIVIALLVVLVSLGLFMSMETLRGTIYRSEVATIVSLMHKARSRAINNIEQSKWGICYLAPNYMVFKGATCSAAAAKDSVAANAGVALASDFANPAKFPTVVFGQLSATTTPASITVIQNDRTSAISINYEGTIIW